MHGDPARARGHDRRAEVRRVVRAAAVAPTGRSSAARVGPRPDGPYVLYACSSPFIAPDEVRVRRALARRRSGRDPGLAEVGVLVRPHPQNAASGTASTSRAFGNVAVWPPAGAQPDAGEARAGFFDSLAHSAAVVGINTSALIEAAILGKSVLTPRVPEFAGTQEGTLHFRYVLVRERRLRARRRDARRAPRRSSPTSSTAETSTPSGPGASSSRSFARTGSTGRPRRSWPTRSRRSPRSRRPRRRRSPGTELLAALADPGGARRRRRRRDRRARCAGRRPPSPSSPDQRRRAPRARRRGSRSRAGRGPGGRTNAQQERLDPSPSAVRVGERRAELGDVLVERRRRLERAAAGVDEVAEVQRPLLRLAELRRADRQHRPSLDERLDHRARVDPDHGRGGVDRVVVERVVLGVIGSAGRHARDDLRAGRRDRPRPTPRRCRDAAARARRDRERRIARRALEPAPDESDLDVAGRDVRRRADVEDDPRAPGRARRDASSSSRDRRRRAVEPAVEELRPGDDDPLARNAVELDASLALDLVPDVQPVGHRLDDPLRRQVVPASRSRRRPGSRAAAPP